MDNNKKKVMHLLSGGGAGGIETLCEQIGIHGKLIHEFCFLYSKGEVYERMNAKGFVVHDLTRRSFVGKCNELLRIAKAGDVDAVVVHHEGPGIYLLYEQLLKRYRKAKYIKYLHRGYEPEYMYSGSVLKDGLHHYLLGKVLCDSDVVISVSNAIRKGYVDEFEISEEKIVTVYNGVELKSDGVEVGAVTKHGNGLLYIGRLVKVKGVDILLRAMTALKERGKDLHLDILGDGPDREEFEELAARLGVSNMVTFQGVVIEKAEFYSKNNVFIYPPVWQEAFGISIVEAMSEGLICVASNIGGIPEIINSEDVGVLFKTGDSESLADAIEVAVNRTAGDEGVRYRLAGIRRASEFDVVKSVNGLEKLILT